MRLALYGVASTLLTAAVLYTAFLTPTHPFPPFRRSNFYTAAIGLSSSSASLLVLLNFGIFATLLWGKVLQGVFFGPLRAIEVEHLYERSWFAVTETCLALTIFRDEFDAPFVTLFVALLFTKIFHWLCQDRVDFLEQSVRVSPVFHIRMVTLMVGLLMADALFVAYSVRHTLERGANMLIVFGFEYAILVAVLLATFCKYVLHLIDGRTEEAWENKSMYIFYLELVADFMKLVIYLIFFVVVVKFYSVPLHIIRDIYVTLRSFLHKCRDLVRYRQATRNMNERYPDATMEELAAMSDPTCIICREEMIHRDDAAARQRIPAPREGRPSLAADVSKKLACGHIFHFACLRSWLERQQSCPTCRSPVLNADPPGPPPQAPAEPAQPAQRIADLLERPPAGQAAQPPPTGSSSQPASQPAGVGVREAPGQALPGVIPLGDLEVPRGDGTQPVRLYVMPPLTAEDVTRLSSGTREAILRRLEVINRTQAHLVALSTVLSQALTLPSPTATVEAAPTQPAHRPPGHPASALATASASGSTPEPNMAPSMAPSMAAPLAPAGERPALGEPSGPASDALSSESDDSETHH
ncbi:hypothetical protein L0F63_004291 [Massospora cicadina]|nr:hypothetical protein L0F63_004291 [Massospora cicadina]